jgi:PKD repeat protein
MKKLIFFLAILHQIHSYSFGQSSIGGYPPTYFLKQLKSYAVFPHFNLDTLNIEKLKLEDKNSPEPLRYSIVQDVDINIKDVGLKTAYNGTDTIWRYKIQSDGAKSIQLIFKKYTIPSGAKLFLYNEDYSQIYGAFTNQNMETDGTFIIADFQGSVLILEYVEPIQSEFKGQLVIGGIGQAYREIFQTSSSIDADGYIGVNCPEGKDWQNQKHAVCRITFRESGSSYLCSGSLINNVNKDGTPYFLTACHCISDSSVAKTMVAYFNYEKIGCTGSTTSYKSITGASLLTTNSTSDYTLLKLSSTPTATYKPFYAGWDASGKTDNSSVGIHHPEGLTKKICFDYSPAVSFASKISWDDDDISPANSHWEVAFDAGTTAGGSSGSPLLNDDKRIIGQLHGGDETYDFYGKLSYSWTNPSTGYKTLKYYLDPSSTGTLILDGYYPATNTPDPQFSSDASTVCLSTPIQFTGYSAFDPASWKWIFTPNSVTYSNSTDSTTQNPVVSFNTASTYTVRLVAENSAGKDTTKYTNMITAGKTIEVSISAVGLKDSCLLNFDSLALVASGASTYKWELPKETGNYFYISRTSGDSATIKKISASNLATSFDLTVKAIGSQSVCVDTSAYVLPLVSQTNDDIANANAIVIGTNGPYTNECATVQTGEPTPPYTSCTGQKSWCNEYDDGTNIVENSVWFYYTATSTGNIKIVSKGMDNEMAIYSATSYSDILNGNYTLLGANDDYSTSDYNPTISKVAVTSGQTYWIQVDGSGGGSEGTFNLTVSYVTATSIDDIVENSSLKIYPQPADDYVILEDSKFSTAEKITLEIYTITGSKIYTHSYQNLEDTIIRLDTENWKKGMYMVRLICDGKQINARMIK